MPKSKVMLRKSSIVGHTNSVAMLSDMVRDSKIKSANN